MPEREVVTSGIGVFQWVWGFLLLPLGWLWSRVNKGSDSYEKLSDELDEHKLDMAQNHFRKDEVVGIVKGIVGPLKESIDKLETKIDRLTERRQNRKQGD